MFSNKDFEKFLLDPEHLLSLNTLVVKMNGYDTTAGKAVQSLGLDPSILNPEVKS